MDTKQIAALICVLCRLVFSSPAVSDRDEFWWSPISRRIEFPCSSKNAEHDSTIDKSLMELLFPTLPDKLDCLRLDLYTVTPLAKEALAVVERLLDMTSMQRWVRGILVDTAKELHTQLRVSTPPRNRDGLTKDKMKVTEDLIDLASFAHYLEETASEYTYKRDTGARLALLDLARKLQVLSCALRPALAASLQSYVTPDDVPVDLRHKKRKVRGRVATYVILEKLEEMLRLLPGSYLERGIKMC